MAVRAIVGFFTQLQILTFVAVSNIDNTSFADT